MRRLRSLFSPVSTLLLLVGYIIGGSQVFVADTRASSATNVSLSECAGVKDMYVVAHEDDDLLFMNPDLATSIRVGHCVRTVFLTAGDAGQPSAYWEAREDGMRAAYAYMAGLGNSWQQKTLAIAGRQLSLSTLDASSKVSLVFLRLPDGVDAYISGTITLERLWNGPTTRIVSMDGANVYSRDDLIHTLTLLMEDFQATSIRTQDPATATDFVHTDHVDHIHAAKFADVAQSQYQHNHTLTRYRGYNIDGNAPNLSEGASQDKLAIFLTYAAHDRIICFDCVKNDPNNDMNGYCHREYFVVDADQSGAVRRSADGRLEVFTISTQSSRLSSTAQSTPNGTWTDWSSLGGRIAAAPVVAGRKDGGLAVFVRGTDHALYSTSQTTPNGAWSSWTSLGGVIASDPVAVSNSDGRLEVFARGTDDGLYHIWQTAANGAWSGWSALGGLTFAGNPAVAHNADGRLQVFVRAGDGSLSTLRQLAPNGTTWSAWTGLGGSFASNPAVGSNVDGRLEVFVRGSDQALYHASQVTPNGSWSAWASLGGAFTYDPFIARNADGRLEVLVRAADGGLRAIHQISFVDTPLATYLPLVVCTVSAPLGISADAGGSDLQPQTQTPPRGSWSSWDNLGGSFAAIVGVASNADGRLEAVVRGYDANLYRKAQVMPSSYWSDWTSLGRPL